MPESFLSIATITVALLPGALYMWAFEKQAGRWGIGASDRLLRFIGVSVLFHAAVAPLSVWFWRNEWPPLRDDQPLDWVLWPEVIAVAVFPIIIGTLVGYGTTNGWRWVRLVTGPNPAPRAWDDLFAGHPGGWVRLRLKSGTWIAGVFANENGLRSYASGYPEDQELLLAATVAVDPDTGEFSLTDDGDALIGEGSILVRWNEVEYLEFINDFQEAS